MKTQVTLTVDSDIKEEFKKIASNMGANMSTLVNMYFTQVVKTGRIEFFYNDNVICSDSNNVFEAKEFINTEKDSIEKLSNFNSFMTACSGK